MRRNEGRGERRGENTPSGSYGWGGGTLLDWTLLPPTSPAPPSHFPIIPKAISVWVRQWLPHHTSLSLPYHHQPVSLSRVGLSLIPIGSLEMMKRQGESVEGGVGVCVRGLWVGQMSWPQVSLGTKQLPPLFVHTHSHTNLPSNHPSSSCHQPPQHQTQHTHPP